MADDTNISIATKMSDRLLQNAKMLRDKSSSLDEEMSDVPNSYNTVADVGCDHGYVSIYLVQSGIAKRAIAMDVRKGPLSGAENNIREYGLSDAIETRLSDGLSALEPGEADGLVIAGMGGKLMIRILEEGNPVKLGIKRAVLQPQSDLDEFRRYLRQKGYSILEEKIIFDEGKYYFPMKVSFLGEPPVGKKGREHNYLSEAISLLTSKSGCDEKMAKRICDRFGECNILNLDLLLKDYLSHGAEVTQSILQELESKSHGRRYDELTRELAETKAVLSLFA